MDAGFQCAGCGEWNVTSVDPSAGRRQEYVEDCQVCCRPWRVLVHHAFRNSLFGLLTIVGLNLGTLIGATVIIEQIFALPGVGRELLQAIREVQFGVGVVGVPGETLALEAGAVLDPAERPDVALEVLVQRPGRDVPAVDRPRAGLRPAAAEPSPASETTARTETASARADLVPLLVVDRGVHPREGPRRRSGLQRRDPG